MIQGNKDWANWYFGIVPLAVFIGVTGVLYNKEILTWKDPLPMRSGDAEKARAGCATVPGVRFACRPGPVRG